MNILIPTPIFPPEIGGPATYTYEISSRLSLENSITIITFSQTPIIMQGVNIVTIPLYTSYPLSSLFRQTHLLYELLKHGQNADLFYIQGPIVVGVASVIAAKILRKPSLLKFVGDIAWESARNQKRTSKTLEEFYEHSLPFNQQLLKIFQRFSLTMTDKIVTPSAYLKKFLHRYHYVPQKKIKVIANAIYTQTTNVSKKTHQIITACRLVSWKNVDKIIAAVHLARKKKPWKLVIVGEGPQLTSLKYQVKKLKAKSWITFAGSLPRLQTHKRIAESQLFVLYSDYEGMPHVIIEAMQLGTSIIASQITPNKEVLHGYGQLVPGHDVKSLATAINARISLTKNKAAAEYAKMNYSWEKHLKSLHKAIATINV